MSDLISRKVLLNELDNKNSPYETIVNIEDTDTTQDIINKTLAEYRKILKDMVKNQPTAYDVEKVINQLSTKMFSAELHGDEWNGQTIDNLLCMGDVYEILKGEVKDE